MQFTHWKCTLVRSLFTSPRLGRPICVSDSPSTESVLLRAALPRRVDVETESKRAPIGGTVAGGPAAASESFVLKKNGRKRNLDCSLQKCATRLAGSHSSHARFFDGRRQVLPGKEDDLKCFVLCVSVNDHGRDESARRSSVRQRQSAVPQKAEFRRFAFRSGRNAAATASPRCSSVPLTPQAKNTTAAPATPSSQQTKRPDARS